MEIMLIYNPLFTPVFALFVFRICLFLEQLQHFAICSANHVGSQVALAP